MGVHFLLFVAAVFFHWQGDAWSVALAKTFAVLVIYLVVVYVLLGTFMVRLS